MRSSSPKLNHCFACVHVALKSASLAVRPGEVHALMGANGAGKSTLVKILTGAVRPDSGTMLVGGQGPSIFDGKPSMIGRRMHVENVEPRGKGVLRLRVAISRQAASSIGAAALAFGRGFAFGTGARMGPGYFPVLLSGLIIAVGLVVGFKGLTIEGPPVERVQLRPISFIVASP